jgi:hypothetical protein
LTKKELITQAKKIPRFSYVVGKAKDGQDYLELKDTRFVLNNKCLSPLKIIMNNEE